ncbi:uncharacterized protein [Prorops nasuta]|uniref:uncharacterized protein n=1 Tax=Prorops nasuta TaxID=863751 RepID=UPI0034CEF025
MDPLDVTAQPQDLILLPCESYLYIEGKIIVGTRAPDAATQDVVRLDCNSMAFLFDEIRYELNRIEIDRCKNVDHRSTNHFNFCVPLQMLLGFYEDCRRVIINARHELVLIRARDDINSQHSSRKIINSKIDLQKVQWRIPHVSLNDYTKLKFLRLIEQNKSITIAFRSWELYEYPLLPETQRHTWAMDCMICLPEKSIKKMAKRKVREKWHDIGWDNLKDRL